MKRSSVFNIFLITLLIIGCSSNENTSAYCPEDGCLLERNNPNERFSETAEQPVETDFEAMETSNTNCCFSLRVRRQPLLLSMFGLECSMKMRR